MLQREERREAGRWPPAEIECASRSALTFMANSVFDEEYIYIYIHYYSLLLSIATVNK